MTWCASPRACPSTPQAPTRSPSVEFPRPAAPARRASISTRRPFKCAHSVSTPTTLGVVDRRANRANTIAARLALLVQPTEGVKITPSFSYQNARKHDISSFWPAYSDVGSGRFINGTPERIPDPDEYYLGTVKLEADVGIGTLVSKTSYYHRDELTAYQGTVFDLAYFQSLIWPTNPDGS